VLTWKVIYRQIWYSARYNCPLPRAVPQAPDVVLLTDFVRNTGRYVFHIRFVVDNYAADMIQAIWFEASANCLGNMSKFNKAAYLRD
jgi:hypothetical protein